MRFEWPIALLALALVPAAAVGYVLLERRRARFALRFPNVEVLSAIAPPSGPGLAAVPAACDIPARRGGVARCPCAPSGRPIRSSRASDGRARRRHVGVDGRERRPADAAGGGQGGRAQVRGEVSRPVPGWRRHVLDRAARVDSRSPTTTTLATQAFDHVPAFGGTALGDAIARAVQLIRPGSRGRGAAAGSSLRATGFPPSAIVLLSDGAQNRGQLRAMEGARLAKKLKIPVYTVALGTAGGTIRISDGGVTQVLSGRSRPGDVEADRPGDRRHVLQRRQQRAAERRVRGPRLAPDGRAYVPARRRRTSSGARRFCWLRPACSRRSGYRAFHRSSLARSHGGNGRFPPWTPLPKQLASSRPLFAAPARSRRGDGVKPSLDDRRLRAEARPRSRRSGTSGLEARV